MADGVTAWTADSVLPLNLEPKILLVTVIGYRCRKETNFAVALPMAENCLQPQPRNGGSAALLDVLLGRNIARGFLVRHRPSGLKLSLDNCLPRASGRNYTQMATPNGITADEAFSLSTLASDLVNKFCFSFMGPLDTESLLDKLASDPEALDRIVKSTGRTAGKVKLRALAQTLKGLQQLRDIQNAEGGCHLLPSMGKAGVGTPVTDAAQSALVEVPQNRPTGTVRSRTANAMPFVCLAAPQGAKAWKAEIKHAFKFWYEMITVLCIGLFRVMIWVIPGCLLVALLFSFSEFLCHVIALPYACAEFVGALFANFPTFLRAIVFNNAGVTSAMDNYRGQYSEYVQPVQQSTYTSMIVVNKSDPQQQEIVYMQVPAASNGLPLGIELSTPAAVLTVLVLWLMNRGGGNAPH